MPTSLISVFFFFFTLSWLGGLYFAICQEGAVKEEDMEVITLLPKTPRFQQELKEVLEFLVEDLNELGVGKFYF